MIHIILGTKAQFIKTAPVMKGLESRGVPYNFVNLGQHGATIERLKEQFGVRSLESGAVGAIHELPLQKDIVSLPEMFKWLMNHLIIIVFRKQYLNNVVFKGEGGIVFIHGDTLSTLIGLLMAKRVGLKVAHIESGLRSWNYLNPFPEETIRVICMRYSDYLFAPSDEAVENLKRMKVKVEVEGKRRIFNTGGNTGMDAVKAVVSGQWSVARDNPPQSPLNLRGEVKGSYVLISIHRFENLYSRKRFQFILNTVDEVSKRFNVVFVMHGPTEKKLRKAGVRGQGSGVSNADHRPPTTDHSVTYLPLQDYPAFLQLIKNAEFVVTDGGSVQEECYYLGKPCLIMRKRTERSDGIGVNAVLSEFDKHIIEEFLNNYKIYERNEAYLGVRISDILIDRILRLQAEGSR